jgi:hypothetical protein
VSTTQDLTAAIAQALAGDAVPPTYSSNGNGDPRPSVAASLARYVAQSGTSHEHLTAMQAYALALYATRLDPDLVENVRRAARACGVCDARVMAYSPHELSVGVLSSET